MGGVDQMVDQNGAYLFKKRGVYYFSKRIPSDLKDSNNVKYDASELNGIQAIGAQLVEDASGNIADLLGGVISGDASKRNEALQALKKAGLGAIDDVA